MNRALSRPVAILFVALAILAPKAARAADGGASGDEKCVVAEQEKDKKECLACRAYYRNYAHCERALAEYGYARSCRTHGASIWREIWCRTPDPSARKVPSNILATLDDATGGEPGDASAGTDGSASGPDAGPNTPDPSLKDASLVAPQDSAGASSAPTGTLAPKGQASGCGTCTLSPASGARSGAPALFLGLSMAALLGARRRRRVTPSKPGRSARW